jgi:hypothetical protein
MPRANDFKSHFETSQCPGNKNDHVKQSAVDDLENQDRHLQKAAAKMRQDMILAEPFHRFDKQVKELGMNTRLEEYEKFSALGLNAEDQTRINDLNGLEKSLQTELKAIRTQAIQKQTDTLEETRAAIQTAGDEAAHKRRPNHNAPSKGPKPPGGHTPGKDPNSAREDAEDSVVKGVAHTTDDFLQERLTFVMKQYEPKINNARDGYFNAITFSKKSPRSQTQTISRDEYSR